MDITIKAVDLQKNFSPFIAIISQNLAILAEHLEG